MSELLSSATMKRIRWLREDKSEKEGEGKRAALPDTPSKKRRRILSAVFRLYKDTRRRTQTRGGGERVFVILNDALSKAGSMSLRASHSDGIRRGF